jgi:predicted nucleic acid-binding protein
MTEPPVGTLVDSNVLLDVLNRDPTWGQWSRAALAEAGDAGPLLINQIVYAEVSIRFSDIVEFDGVLSGAGLVRSTMPWPAAFLSDKCYLAYRRRGGAKTSPLPDFYIGAHAAVLGLRLLTRDAARYRTYFPTVELIAPA